MRQGDCIHSECVYAGRRAQWHRSTVSLLGFCMQEEIGIFVWRQWKTLAWKVGYGGAKDTESAGLLGGPRRGCSVYGKNTARNGCATLAEPRLGHFANAPDKTRH